MIIASTMIIHKIVSTMTPDNDCMMIIITTLASSKDEGTDRVQRAGQYCYARYLI